MIMNDRRSPSPGSRQEGYELSYNLAREQLAAIDDLKEQCRRSGAQYVSANKIVVDYLGQPYQIALPAVEVSLADGEVEVPLKDKILILHYLTLAQGTQASGQLITYKQLPGGNAYFGAFLQRAITPLVRRFGSDPDSLLSAAAKLGGRQAGHGDVSVTIKAFPRVHLTLVLWRGDDEVAPNGNVLFDSSASDYLSTEDLTVVSETIVWKLVRDTGRR